MNKKSLIVFLSLNLFCFNSNSMLKRSASMMPIKRASISSIHNYTYVNFLGKKYLPILVAYNQQNKNNQHSKSLFYTSMVTFSGAAFNYNDDKVKYKTVDVNMLFGTDLMRAAFDGSNFKITLLISLGKNVNDKNVAGHTALHYAIANNQIEAVKLLIKYKADVNAKGSEKETPLMLAAVTNNEEIAKLLIDNGANIHAQARHGSTALMVAAIHGNFNIFKMLLKNGANINDKDYHGKTLLDVAYYGGNKDIVKLVLELNNTSNAAVNKEEQLS